MDLSYGMVGGMAISLGLTIVIEIIFALVFRVTNRKDLLLICLVNFITNPSLVFLLNYLVGRAYLDRELTLFILEMAVFAVEALLLKLYSKKIRRPVLFAAGANLSSYLIGHAIEVFLLM